MKKRRRFRQKMKVIWVLMAILTVHSCISKTAVRENETVKAEEIIKKLENGENVFYENKTIDGNIDLTLLGQKFTESPVLTRAAVSGSFTLIHCRVNGNITGYSPDEEKLTSCFFGKNFSLIDCTVEGEVIIRESVFTGNVNCTKTAFKRKVSFEGSIFQSSANFSSCIFLGEARFHNCFFNWKSNFMDGKFAMDCGFQGSTFNGDAQFSSIRCSQYADFTLTTFGAGAFFNYASFDDRLSFGGTTFKGRCDFNNATFTQDATFKDNRFYGSTRFNSINVFKLLNLESSIFMNGKPEVSVQSEEMNDRINWKDARMVKFD